MAKPNRMEEIEREYGERRETLLPRILNECGTMEAAADKLNISFRNLYEHCNRLGIKRQSVYVREGQPHVG